MKTFPVMLGMAAGMTLGYLMVTAMYPDVGRRMMRDSRRAVRCGKRMMNGMFN